MPVAGYVYAPGWWSLLGANFAPEWLGWSNAAQAGVWMHCNGWSDATSVWRCIKPVSVANLSSLLHACAVMAQGMKQKGHACNTDRFDPPRVDSPPRVVTRWVLHCLQFAQAGAPSVTNCPTISICQAPLCHHGLLPGCHTVVVEVDT